MMIERSLDNFRKDQVKVSKSAEEEVNVYLKKLNALYADAFEQLRIQRAAIDEINSIKPSKSPPIYDSLDQFKRLYNESLEFVVNLPSSSAKHMRNLKPTWLQQPLEPTTEKSIEPFSKRIDRLDKALRKQWDAVVDATHEGSNTADRKVREILSDINNVQEKIQKNAKLLSEISKSKIKSTLSKKEVQEERIALDRQLKKLESDSRAWMDEKIIQLDIALRSLQDKLTSSRDVYEELLTKKKSSFYYRYIPQQRLYNIIYIY